VVVGGIAGTDLNPMAGFGTFAAWDPATGAWRTLAPPPVPIAQARAVAIDGRVVWAVPGAAGTTWPVYDPATDAWTTTSPVPPSVVRIGSAVLADDEVVAIAATIEDGGPVGLRLLRWDPAGGAFTLSALAPGVTAPFTVPAWSGREVLVQPNDGGPLAAWDPADDTWRTVAGTAPWPARRATAGSGSSPRPCRAAGSSPTASVPRCGGGTAWR
jgi:hypothetical protein